MQDTDEKYIPMSVRLPEKMHDRLKEDAARNFRPLSNQHPWRCLNEHLERADG